MRTRSSPPEQQPLHSEENAVFGPEVVGLLTYGCLGGEPFLTHPPAAGRAVGVRLSMHTVDTLSVCKQHCNHAAL